MKRRRRAGSSPARSMTGRARPLNSAELPRLVRATVTRHENFGFAVDLGEEQEGIVVITMISDDPDEATPEFPEIGQTVWNVRPAKGPSVGPHRDDPLAAGSMGRHA